MFELLLHVDASNCSILRSGRCNQVVDAIKCLEVQRDLPDYGVSMKATCMLIYTVNPYNHRLSQHTLFSPRFLECLLLAQQQFAQVSPRWRSQVFEITASKLTSQCLSKFLTHKCHVHVYHSDL